MVDINAGVVRHIVIRTVSMEYPVAAVVSQAAPWTERRRKLIKDKCA